MGTSRCSRYILVITVYPPFSVIIFIIMSDPISTDTSHLLVTAVRLEPEQDLRHALTQFARTHQLQAACILSGIGSLSQAALRFADQPDATILSDHFELISLSGTLSMHGLHLHGAIANPTGAILGGHICSGCLIYTTAEIMIGQLPHLLFTRQPDSKTGFLELTIQSSL